MEPAHKSQALSLKQLIEAIVFGMQGQFQKHSACDIGSKHLRDYQ